MKEAEISEMAEELLLRLGLVVDLRMTREEGTVSSCGMRGGLMLVKVRGRGAVVVVDRLTTTDRRRIILPFCLGSVGTTTPGGMAGSFVHQRKLRLLDDYSEYILSYRPVAP